MCDLFRSVYGARVIGPMASNSPESHIHRLEPLLYRRDVFAVSRSVDLFASIDVTRLFNFAFWAIHSLVVSLPIN